MAERVSSTTHSSRNIVAGMSNSHPAALADQPMPLTGGDHTHMSAFPRRILVAIGPGHDADVAVNIAATLAAATNAELLLLGIADVATPPLDEIGDTDLTYVARHWPNQEVLDSLMRRRLEQVAASLPATIHVRTTLDWGNAAGALLNAERVELPDLIVVPNRHTSVAGRLLHEHGIHRVLRRTGVPVLVVPAVPEVPPVYLVPA
jgi:nucleotide-binding universal stress UspA family protein